MGHDTGMTRKPLTSLESTIEALPEDLRHRVLERASILFDSGHDWEEADALAYAMETRRAAPGLARASEPPPSAQREAPKSCRARR